MRRRPGLARLAIALAVAAAVAGCGSQARVALPRKSAALAGSSGLSSPKLTARQQVIAAYTGYWQAYGAAISSQSAAQARAILAPYDPPAALARAVQADRRVWAAHDTVYGSAVPHVLSVRLTGKHALLHDCLDLSHFGVQNSRTGQVIPQSIGLSRLNFYVTLTRSGGRWLISNMQPVVVPCKP
jgi:hypothetical protein